MPRNRTARIARWVLRVTVAVAVVAISSDPLVAQATARRTGEVRSADGVPISYSTSGSGRPALVFVHGGFVDREFWKEQASLAEDFQIVTLDLAGHGDSGAKRQDWSIDAFGEDVRAVVEELELDRFILVGNSLGGPVSLSAAKALPGAIGVIGVDTFQDVDLAWTDEEMRAYIDGLRVDFPAVCKQMMGQLLAEDSEPELAAWVEEKMCGFDRALAHHVVSGFLGYDGAAAFAEAEVPIRAILGETVPLDLAGNRELQSDFRAVVMPGLGHYPMLEAPEEFNRHLRDLVQELTPTESSLRENDLRLDYVEFEAKDIEKTKAFYQEIFGWEFTDYGPNYTSFADGRLSGGFELASAPSTGGPLVVIYAVRLEEVEARVRQHGGEIAREIFNFPGGRRFHFVDPNGHELAVWSDQ